MALRSPSSSHEAKIAPRLSILAPHGNRRRPLNERPVAAIVVAEVDEQLVRPYLSSCTQATPDRALRLRQHADRAVVHMTAEVLEDAETLSALARSPKSAGSIGRCNRTNPDTPVDCSSKWFTIKNSCFNATTTNPYFCSPRTPQMSPTSLKMHDDSSWPIDLSVMWLPSSCIRLRSFSLLRRAW